MIMFGSRTTLLVRKPLRDECSECGAENSIDLTLYQKYRYFFGIPVSPAGKMPMTECSNCRNVMEKSEFSLSLLEQYEAIKKDTCVPVWMYFGSVLFVFIIGLCLLFLFVR